MTADAFALPIPGRAPVTAATARYIAVVLALVLLIVGFVALRDAGVVLGFVAGSPWIGTTATALNGLHSQWWMVPAGAGHATVTLRWAVTRLPVTVSCACGSDRPAIFVSPSENGSTSGVSSAARTASRCATFSRTVRVPRVAAPSSSSDSRCGSRGSAAADSVTAAAPQQCGQIGQIEFAVAVGAEQVPRHAEQQRDDETPQATGRRGHAEQQTGNQTQCG